MKFLYLNINNKAVEKAYDRIYDLFNIDKVKIFDKKEVEDSLALKDDKEVVFVCANIWHVLYLKCKALVKLKKIKIIFWVQGAVAHESFLKNKSYFRFSILWLLEYISLIFSDFYIYVSPYMKEYYEKKFFTLNKKSIVIPCISDLNQNIKIKRNPDNYCYIGGMSKWQNFETIIEMMNIIIENNNGAKFSVATNDLKTCNNQLEKMATNKLLKVTSVVSLSSKQEIENFLSAASFGFLIRDDIVVNNVASPIKLAEYFSCGINVISTKGITSYTNLIEQAGFVINENNLDSIKEIKFIANEKEALRIFDENFSANSISNAVDIFLKDLGLSS